MAIMVTEEKLRKTIQQALIYAYHEGLNQGVDEMHLVNNGTSDEELISGLVDSAVADCKKD